MLPGIILIVFIILSCGQKKNRVMIIIPDNYEGRIMIFFNDQQSPPLPDGKYGYYASFNDNPIVRTSITLKNNSQNEFYLVRWDSTKHEGFQDTTMALLNYSDWYSGKQVDKLNGEYNGKEVYVGYFYRSIDKASSKDSLYTFLKEINGDTLLVTPSVVKSNY